MSETRPLCIMETPYSTVAPCYIQLGIEVSDPSKIKEYCKRIMELAVGFHLTVDVENKTVILDHHSNKVFEMPNSVDNLEAAINWSMANAKPNETTQVATLAANDRFIVYNSNHAWSDGGQWIRIVEEMQRDDYKAPEITMPPSVLSEKTFKKAVEESEPLFVSMFDKSMTQFRVEAQYKGDDSKFVRSAFPVSTLKGYKDGHMHQLTASLVAAFILATKAFSGYDDDGYGVQSAINIRRYLEEPLRSSMSFGYQSGNIVIQTKEKPETVDDLINQLDKTLKEEIDKEAFLGHTRYLLLPLLHPDDKRYIPQAPRGLGLYLTNIGRFKVKEPIKDIMLNVHQTVLPYSVVLLSYSVDSEKDNVLHNHFIHRLTDTSSEVMQKYMDLLNYALVNMKRDSSIADFVNYLKEHM